VSFDWMGDVVDVLDGEVEFDKGSLDTIEDV
jgi:hypothetical protein